MKELFTDSNTPVVDSNRILYTATSFARSSLLHLQEIGELHAKKSHTSKRSGLQSYLFFTVLSGSGTLIYNDKGYELRKGSCVFIDCNSPYSHTTDENNLWTLRWIHFYGPTMSNIYQKYCERGGRPVFSLSSEYSVSSASTNSNYHTIQEKKLGGKEKVEQKKLEDIDSADPTEKIDRIASVWSSLFTTASGADYMRDMLINQYLSTLLTIIMSESWHPEDQEDLPKKRMQLIVVKEWIDENYGSKITLDQLSHDFFINKYYLSKSFKEQYGVSISNYLLSVRITKAKQLLRFSDKTVEAIGYECGLGAPHYFSQRFKEVEGVPPSKYREQW